MSREIFYCTKCATILEDSGDDLRDHYEDLVYAFHEEGTLKLYPNKKQQIAYDHLEKIGAIVTTEGGEKSLKIRPVGLVFIENENGSFFEVCFKDCIKIEN